MLVDTVINLAFTNIYQMIMADGHEIRTLNPTFHTVIVQSRISFGWIIGNFEKSALYMCSVFIIDCNGCLPS